MIFVREIMQMLEYMVGNKPSRWARRLVEPGGWRGALRGWGGWGIVRRAARASRQSVGSSNVCQWTLENSLDLWHSGV